MWYLESNHWKLECNTDLFYPQIASPLRERYCRLNERLPNIYMVSLVLVLNARCAPLNTKTPYYDAPRVYRCWYLLRSNRSFAFLTGSHEFHFQREDSILWLLILFSSSHGCTYGSSANWAAFLVASVECLVKAFRAEEVATMCDCQICWIVHANDAVEIRQPNRSGCFILLLFLD